MRIYRFASNDEGLVIGNWQLAIDNGFGVRASGSALRTPHSALEKVSLVTSTPTMKDGFHFFSGLAAEFVLVVEAGFEGAGFFSGGVTGGGLAAGGGDGLMAAGEAVTIDRVVGFF